MKYLDKDSEIVLKAIINIENIGFFAYIDHIHTATLGKYMKYNDLPRILLSLCNLGYVFSIINPVNGLIHYVSQQEGKTYVKTKIRYNLHEIADWIKVFGGTIIGAILGIIITIILKQSL